MTSSAKEESKLPGGYLVTPRVPQGLAAAVEGLTREVIRHSPEDIYVFAAHHFEKLLRERCGPEKIATNRDSNFKTLTEMSQALRMREADPTNVKRTRKNSDQVGWSLNETAKVLKRHRSIFGDASRQISTLEVFHMANRKEKYFRTVQSLSGKIEDPANARIQKETRLNQKPSVQNADDVWKASGSRLERSGSNAASPEVISETRIGPRIITQIPSLRSSTRLLAKDIKSELRKNRISSRERSVWAKPDDGSGNDNSECKSGTKASERHGCSIKSSKRHKRMETDVEKRNRRLVHSTTVSKERQNRQRTLKSRAVSMDRVNDYVVQRFATTKSLVELQTANYAEKVQEIIDETGPIIKGKVEELKCGMIGRSKRSSWFADDTNDNFRDMYGSGRGSRVGGKNSTQKDSAEGLQTTGPTADALRTRLTETQRLLENVSTKMASPRRSRSVRASRRSLTTSEEISNTKNSGKDELSASITVSSNRDNGLERRLRKTRNLLEDISLTLSRPMKRSSSAKSLRRQEENDDFSDLGAKNALKTKLDETRNLLEGISGTFAMPGHKVGSAFRRFDKASANLTSEELSFSEPQNTSEVSLPAVKSASAKSSSGNVSRNNSDNLILPAISPEAPKSKKVKEALVLPVLSPSINGSSSEETKIGDDIDVFAEQDILEIPVDDYIIEPMTEDVFRDSLNVTPDFDSVPQRPDSLDPVETAKDIEAHLKMDNFEERLHEIQKVNIDSNQVLISKTSVSPRNSDDFNNLDMKKRFQKLDVGTQVIKKRCNREVCRENKVSPNLQTEPDTSVEAIDESSESVGGAQENIGARKIAANQNGVNEKKEKEFKGDEQQIVNASDLLTKPLNNTYVLTEGSPHDIPDTVTTVVIPERIVQSPELDSLDEELTAVMDPNLLLFSRDATRIYSNEIHEINGQTVSEVSRERVDETDGKLVEIIDKNIKITTVDGTSTEVSGQQSSELPVDHIATEARSSPLSLKDGYQPNQDDFSTKKTSDAFGELVEPERIDLLSPDIDFIRDIESHPEILISRQDLGRINEEISEELEGPDKRNEVAEESNIETIKKTKEEVAVQVREGPAGLAMDQKNDDNEVVKGEVDGWSEAPEAIDGVEDTEGEVNKGGTRISPNRGGPGKDKENDQIKKSKVIKGNETPRMPNTEITNEKEVKVNTCGRDSSMSSSEKENDAVGRTKVDLSKSRTVSDLSREAYKLVFDSESSNESKESSERDEPFESAKCVNSFDEEESNDTRSPESSNEVKETTLTDGLSLSLDPTRPFVPELNLDSLQDITVSSFKLTEDEYDNQDPGGSGKTNSIDDTLTFDENHRIIEGVESAEVAVLEYLVPSSAQSHAEEAGVDQKEVVEEQIVMSRVVTGPSYEEESLANVDCKLDEVDRPIRSEKVNENTKEHIIELCTGRRWVEIPATNKKEDKRIKAEPENMTEEKLIVNPMAERVADKTLSEKQRKLMEADGTDDQSASEQCNDKSANFKVTKVEEINGDHSKFSEGLIVGDVEDNNRKIADSVTKESSQGDLSGQIRLVEEVSDEILKESFVEEDTPLAVSRSASQCTTRRASSGNLARLREDPTLGSAEEMEQEIVDDEDWPPSKVKSSKIGRETIREQGSAEIKPSQDSGSQIKFSDDTNEKMTKYSKEYPIHVPEVNTSEDKLMMQSSIVDIAVTRIQARVRGFLTRRRIDRGQHRRSFKLCRIPSIQDSIAVEPFHIGGQQPDTAKRTYGRTEGIDISSAMILDEHGLVNASTMIQSKYRRDKARKRLRREDVVHRTSLSVEKSFAESGVRHTGEFHDCIPLPIHDITMERQSMSCSDNKFESFLQQLGSHSLGTESISYETRNIEQNVINIAAQTRGDLGGSQNPKKMFLGESSDISVIHFGMSPNIGHLVDLVIPAKDEAALENNYLNFITSVEDAEAIGSNLEINSSVQELTDGNCSKQSLKEPLALLATPVGLIIEEITNSDGECFLNNHSAKSSIIVPKNPTESLATPRAPSETISKSMEGSKMGDIISGAPMTLETSESHRSQIPDGENLVLSTESLNKENGIRAIFSMAYEKGLLGPESSVYSLECPIVGSRDRSSSRSSEEIVEISSVTKNIGEVSNEGISSYEEKNASLGLEAMRQSAEDERPTTCNMDEESSALSFSLTAEDFLRLGPEDSLKVHGRRPILEVTLTPGDIMKSMSLSQESQLAGERIESPITMVQLAPPHSDSLQGEEPPESGCKDRKTPAKLVRPTSA